jgi:hypothetical protein
MESSRTQSCSPAKRNEAIYILYYFDQFGSHASQQPVSCRNLSHVMRHRSLCRFQNAQKCVKLGENSKICPSVSKFLDLSQVMAACVGVSKWIFMSRSQRCAELIEIVQYTPPAFYYKHFNENLILRRVRRLPSLVQKLADNVDTLPWTRFHL